MYFDYYYSTDHHCTAMEADISHMHFLKPELVSTWLIQLSVDETKNVLFYFRRTEFDESKNAPDVRTQASKRLCFISNSVVVLLIPNISGQ